MIKLLIYAAVLLGSVYEGYSMRFLTISGSIAAAFVGGAVLLGFGWRGLSILGIFFLTSSLWSRYKREVKKKIEQKHVKGSTRDWTQVVANGGVAAVFSLLFFQFDQRVWLIAFLIAIASANSDTWASEIGTLSKKPPLFIRTFKRIDSGTSGAISVLGSVAGLLGSLLIAIFSGLLFSLNMNEMVIIFLFGFLGNIIDTLFGAFFQVTYRCTVCQTETEKNHHCQQPTKLIRGFSFLNNDTVNLLSGLLSSILFLIIFWD